MEINFVLVEHHRTINIHDAVAVPSVGDLVSIKGTDWEVTKVFWAIDHSDRPDRSLRATVQLELLPGGE